MNRYNRIPRRDDLTIETSGGNVGDLYLSDADWPPIPVAGRPYTLDEQCAFFGRFEYEADPSSPWNDNIRILGKWETDQIIDVPIPQLNGKLRRNGQRISDSMIRFHRAGQQRLCDLWRTWQDAGLLERILVFEGSYVPRFVRGAKSDTPRPLSRHSWGTAFDINAYWNAFRTEPALIGQIGCVRELVEIANALGFFWGGHFSTGKDGMHFELGNFL
jgi:D-alanyl-D-alanine carboxypeptidase